MILCVTPNPGVEHTVTVPNFRQGEVNRTTSVIAYTGGKGFNASRSIQMLGGDYCSLSIAGGHSGEIVKEMTHREGLNAQWTAIDNEVRFVMIVVDPAQGDATVINEEGPTLSAQEWQRFTADAIRLGQGASAICLCGSLPGATPAAWLGEMAGAIKQAGIPVWIDNRGKALELALPFQPDGIKFNGKEAATLLGGREIDSVQAALAAAQEFRRRGIANVNITLGEKGALLLNSQGAWHVQPPIYQPVNSAGSGDAFFGGLLHGLDRNLAMPDALRIAAAAGAANALTQLAGEVHREDYERAWRETRVGEVA